MNSLANLSTLQVGRAPSNRRAEQALLGALLLDNALIDEVSERLDPECFYEPVHGRIFEQVIKARERGSAVDANLLAHLFEEDAALADVGGADYLAQLELEGNAVYSIKTYKDQVHELHMRRELMRVGREVVSNAQRIDEGPEAEEQIELAEQALFNLSETGDADRGPRSLGQAASKAAALIAEAKDRKGGLSGLDTGFHDFNQLFGGLQKSDLMIIAARPAMGKTAFATNIAFNAAKRADARVLFFALEMSAEQLAMRLLSERCEIPTESLRKGIVSNAQFSEVMTASSELEALSLTIDDTPALTVAGLLTRARRHKQKNKGKLDLIVVDYLQLLQGSRSAASDGRVQEISEISRGLKSIAKELDVPVIALSQLSRAVESRDDKRPQLSDLRESGSIEQDADEVVFIYRQAYYDRLREPKKQADESDDTFLDRMQKWQAHMDEIDNKATLIVGKNRHGPTRDLQLHFEGRFTKFSDLAEDSGYHV